MADSSDEHADRNNFKELRDYLKKVSEELAKREEKVSVLEAEIAQLNFKLKELRINQVIGAGDISAIGSLERFRGHLKDELARRRAALQELNVDVQRARDRREDVMKEISDLDMVDGE